MKHSTTRLKEAASVRAGLPLIILLIVLVIGLSACTLRSGDASDQPPRFFDSISNRSFMSMRKQTDALITELLSYMENQDQAAFTAQFAPNVISDPDILEQQCNDLFQFFSGTVESQTWEAAQNSASKELDEYHSETKVAYDIVTTEDHYRIAMNFCAEDNYDDGNLGLYSIYIIRFEDTDTKYTYWGDGNWTPGINVVTEPQA